MAKVSTFFQAPSIEALPGVSQQGLSVKSYQKNCVDFHWHFHPEVELTLIEKGQGVRYVGTSVEPFRAGDWCLFGSNLPHAFRSHPSERKGGKWTVLHFLPEAWGHAFWKLPENRAIIQLLKNAQRGICFDAKESKECKKLWNKLARKGSGPTALATWIELLERLCRLKKFHYLNSHASSLHQKQQADYRLEKVMAWIDENSSSTELTQARAAQHIDMSPQAFCRFFRQTTGRTFQYYVNEVRVTRVCSELLDFNRNISETAFACGFNNIANFIRRFREITGKTPREFRKMEEDIRSS